jgi:DNA-binding MarR family transcriptional regulator
MTAMRIRPTSIVRIQSLDSNITDSVDRLLESWMAVRPDIDLSPVAVVARLGRLRRLIETELETVYAEHGLTGPDFSALVTLRRLGGDVSQAELGRGLGLTAGTVSVRVDRLVARGLAERRVDGRVARVSLTDAGAGVFERVTPAHVAAEERLLAALDAGERSTLVALLRKLLVSFEGSAAGGDLPRLGAVLSPAHVTIAMRRAVGLPPVAGLLVREVEPGGAADAAGLRTGDVLELRSIAELHAALREGRLDVGVVRGVERLRVAVPLVCGDAPPAPGAALHAV